MSDVVCGHPRRWRDYTLTPFRAPGRGERGVAVVRANRWAFTFTLCRHPYLWTRHQDDNWPDRLGRAMALWTCSVLWFFHIQFTHPTGRRVRVEHKASWYRWFRKETHTRG